MGVWGSPRFIYTYVFTAVQLAGCWPLYVVSFEPFSVHTRHNIADAEMFFFYSVWVVAPLPCLVTGLSFFHPISAAIVFGCCVGG